MVKKQEADEPPVFFVLTFFYQTVLPFPRFTIND